MHGLSGDRTLKSTISQEWIVEWFWFCAWWYKFRKAKSDFNNSLMGEVRTGQGILGHGALKFFVF